MKRVVVKVNGKKYRMVREPNACYFMCDNCALFQKCNPYSIETQTYICIEKGGDDTCRFIEVAERGRYRKRRKDVKGVEQTTIGFD